jgi:hypothetical protein
VSRRTLDPHRLGLDPDCEVPSDDWILLGVDLGDGGSVWLRMQLRASVSPHIVCDVLSSTDDKFPDAAFIAQHQPMLMAIASPEEWRLLGHATRDEFVQHLVAGEIELGGNFGRFRRNLEWLLKEASRGELGARLLASVEAPGLE